MLRDLTVGTYVWQARFTSLVVSRPCPVCFKKLEVVVELGDGTRVRIPCEYCARGYGEPRGVLGDHEWVELPKLQRVTEVEVRTSTAGRTERYTLEDSSVSDGDDLYATEEPAKVRSKQLAAEYRAAEENRAAAEKRSVIEKSVWLVGYHRREAKRLRASLSYHEARAVELKGGGTP